MMQARQPDHEDLLNEIETNGNGAVGIGITSRKVELAHATRHQRGFSGRHVAGGECTAAAP